MCENLYPVHSSVGKRAATEFQKLLDHPGCVINISSWRTGASGRCSCQRLTGENFTALYRIDFLAGNAVGMQEAVNWAAGRPVAEHLISDYQADPAAYLGRRKEAWTLTRRAEAVSRRENENESAAKYLARAALRDAELENPAAAMEHAEAALQLFPSRDMKILVVLAVGRAGDTTRAEDLTHELALAYPTDTMLNFYWIPTVRAAIASIEIMEPTQSTFCR